MSSLARRNVAALCFFVFCNDAARVKVKNARAIQEQQATIDLELENNITAGPPKEDCSVYDLDSEDMTDTRNIKYAILDQIPELCKGGINQGYAEHSVWTGKVHVALQLQVSPRSRTYYKICGFVSLKLRPASVHVDLICSHMGYGGVLLPIAEASAIVLRKPHVDLDSVPSARTFYEKKGFKHCGDPCDKKTCSTKHEEINVRGKKTVKDDLYVMKKCISSAAASRAPVPITSSGVKARKDITRFFVRRGSEDQKTFISNDKTYRCCCTVVNLCHLVVEGRDELPFFWRTGFSGCGAYLGNSHSWNAPEWKGKGRCFIEDDSLTYQDFKALNAAMQVAVGDTVKINRPGGTTNGKIGRVAFIDTDENTCRLQGSGIRPDYDYPLSQMEYLYTFESI